jgi:transposase
MEVLHPRCAGADVHKDNVVVCVRLAEGASVERRLDRFGTTTGELLRLLEHLQQHGVTHLGMEATGVYWKPLWHVLHGHVALILGNAREIRNVPGRKSDTNDATWLADLVAHGLVRSSFVPPPPIQALRDLTRTRKQLVRERAQHVQRIQKVLEDANLKLASVLRDILGASGRAILEAILRGERDAGRLADLADARVKATRQQRIEALQGRVNEHHCFLLRLHLRQIDACDQAIASVEQRIDAQLSPFRRQVELLCTIPGICQTMAAILLAEAGPDMRAFVSAAHLVSWAGLSPQLDETNGKKRSSRTRPRRWLKTALVQAAWAAVRRKDSYLHAQFLRVRARRGAKKAILAVANSMLTAAYHMLRNDEEYHDPGADFFQRHDRERAARQLVRRLERLGFSVDLRSAA